MREKETIQEVKNEIANLTKKILDRVKELGEIDVMSYRQDNVIRESIHQICEKYQKVFNSCTYLDDDAAPFCRLFRDEPAIIRRLELSEEKLCPLRPD